MNHTKKHQRMAFLVVAASLLAGPMARADVVTDWNIKAGDIVVEAKLGPAPANRVLALVHTAVYEEVAQARIYDGVHYRTSTEVGTAIGKQIGALAVAKYLRPPK